MRDGSLENLRNKEIEGQESAPLNWHTIEGTLRGQLARADEEFRAGSFGAFDERNFWNRALEELAGMREAVLTKEQLRKSLDRRIAEAEMKHERDFWTRLKETLVDEAWRPTEKWAA